MEKSHLIPKMPLLKKSNFRIVPWVVVMAVIMISITFSINYWHVRASSTPYMKFPNGRDSSNKELTISSSYSTMGLTFTLSNIHRINNHIVSDVCYPLIDNKDWMIWRAIFQYGGLSIQDFETKIIKRESPQDQQIGMRCDQLSFEVPSANYTLNGSITISSIAALPREGEMCTIFAGNLQKKLDENKTAIKIKCDLTVNGEVISIISKPDNISIDEAEKLVRDDKLFTIVGPWAFQVTVE
jgi:hypothetical protein